MELDPVEVLNHLKALGYEHVEPHLLKNFMKGMNLRKYNIYDLFLHFFIGNKTHTHTL